MKNKSIKKVISKWICTDPDTRQFGRYLSPGIYEFKTKGSAPVEIDLNKYSEGVQEHVIKSYYSGSIEEIQKNLKDSYNWIMAECIYETYFEPYQKL